MAPVRSAGGGEDVVDVPGTHHGLLATRRGQGQPKVLAGRRDDADTQQACSPGGR
jgi:hypothetical protein